MAINHGFHATTTAQPGKGDELIDFPLKPPSLSNNDCVEATLMGRLARILVAVADPARTQNAEQGAGR